MSRQVIVVQPYVPAYRVPLFERLHAGLATDDIDLVIAHSHANRRAVTRGDAADLDFARSVGTRQGFVGGHEIRHRRLNSWRADLVIGEHALGSLDTYELLVRAGGPTALWGHTRPLDDMDRSLTARLTRWQLRRTRHFFAYTERGRQEAIAWGMDRHAITVLNNTTDTTALREAIAAVTSHDVAALTESLRLHNGPVIVFVGSLDEAKRPDLLLDTVDELHRRDPAVQAVVAGDGALQPMLDDAAASRPWLHLIGRADPQALAVLGRIGDLLLIPSGVGLIAVDALVLGLPIVTSPAIGKHGPEFDYLVDGRNAVFADGTTDALASAVDDLLHNPQRLERMREAARTDAKPLSIESMAERFRQGIMTALDG